MKSSDVSFFSFIMFWLSLYGMACVNTSFLLIALCCLYFHPLNRAFHKVLDEIQFSIFFFYELCFYFKSRTTFPNLDPESPLSFHDF
jgi:hypothetical protein